MANPYYSSTHWRTLRKQRLEMDGYRCCVDGCTNRGCVADHIETRQDVPYPCAQDVLTNLRTVCLSHDAQVKERGGVRKQGGVFRVKGCDADGIPFDPKRRWR